MRFSIFLLIFALTCGFSNAGEYRIDLSPEGFKLFSKRGWGKKTIYENLIDENGMPAIKATALASATNIGIKIEDPDLIKKYSYLNFNIQVLQDFTKDPKQKEKDGHDYVCRVLYGVGKKIGSKVISLAHSSWLPQGFEQRSPWSKGSFDVIVSNDNSGNPIQIKVNVLKLLEKHHESLGGKINFLALFTDSNNTKEKVQCIYRDIFFSDR